MKYVLRYKKSVKFKERFVKRIFLENKRYSSSTTLYFKLILKMHNYKVRHDLVTE